MGSQQLIANELLAFIQHAIDTMDEVSILQICKSNFKEDEVRSGKLLLFQTLGKLDQMPSRRRDGTEKSIEDIITLLKVTDPDDVPAFVAKDLHRLPPVTFDHVDVTRLLKDITSLKTSLAEVQSKLEASDTIISELRAEVLLLRNAASVSGSHDACNVNTRRGAQNVSVGSFASASSDASHAADIADAASCSTAVATSKPVEDKSRVGTSTPKPAYAAIVATGKANQPKRQTENRGKQSRCESTHKVPQQNSLQKDRCDKDGFIKVEKRKKKHVCRNQCGTAPTGLNHLLRPAVPVTPLYVSRLHYSTKAEEIVEYIRIKAKFTLRVVRLDSRHNVNFNSFVVRVPTEHLATFMKEEFWPKGVVFRRFRGRIPDTERHTTPALRVN